jgi:hypothetical protein
MVTRRSALWLVLLCGATACVTSRGQSCRDAGDPGEVARLAMTTDSTLLALRKAPDSQATWLRQYLQAVVDRTASLEECGRIADAGDLRTAARIGLASAQLGLPTVERAYRWARRAVVADTADRRSWRMMATAWDQLQLARKQPQWFATVIECGSTTDGRCTLAPVDTSRVTDPQRVELGLRTLVQQRMIIDSLNRARGRP